MGSQLLVRSFSRQGYSFFLRHVDEVSYGYLMHVFIHFPEDISHDVFQKRHFSIIYYIII